MHAPASPQSSPRVELQQLCFGYPGRSLFSDFSAQIGGGLTLVRGDDGSGKTSLLRLLAGQLSAQSGTLTLDGLPAGAIPWNAQVFYSDPSSTDQDTWRIPDWQAALQTRYADFDSECWNTLLDALGLVPHQDKQLYMLSTGSKRKLWLAAAAASGARLTLLEQPFAALDQRSVQVVLQLLADAAAQTHRAWVMADYVAPQGVPLAQQIDLDRLQPR